MQSDVKRKQSLILSASFSSSIWALAIAVKNQLPSGFMQIFTVETLLYSLASTTGPTSQSVPPNDDRCPGSVKEVVKVKMA